MIVAKFGGTSVSSQEAISTICKIVRGYLNSNPVVVVSALSGVTNSLLSLPTLPKYKFTQELRNLKSQHIDLINRVFTQEQLKKEVKEFINQKIAELGKLPLRLDNPKKTLDKIASYGEIMSSFLVAKALVQVGIKAASILATELIMTNNNFNQAEFILSPTKRKVKKVLSPMIKKGIVPVVTGFIGATRKGEVTTLGRGGSDYTASIIGFCLKAQEIQIWTDVDGIYTADPRLVKKARSLPIVSFREAAELATFGARVLHPRTMHPAIKVGIPVRVLNIFNPKGTGTVIVGKTKNAKGVRVVSFKRKITLVNIYSTEMLLQKGFLARVFAIFAKNNISVDLVSVSEVSVSVTLDNTENLPSVIAELSKFTKVTVSENLGMVSLIGEEITDSSNTIKNIFAVLDNQKILPLMVSLGATNIDISIIVKSGQVERVVKILHQKLLIGDTISPE